MVFHVQVRNANGKHTLTDLAPNATIYELVLKAFPNENELSANRVKLRKGFPPTPISIQRGDETLSELGIRHGDQLSIDLCPPPKLQRVTVPADNSCLFTSIHFCLSGSVDSLKAGFMRDIIAGTVLSDRSNYNSGVLGKSNEEYADFITKDKSWGGAIEAQILADYFGVVITVVVAQTASITHFGDEKQYGQRMFLLYDGIHYDPLSSEDPNGQRVTLFPISDHDILEEANSVAKRSNSNKQFTDVANFDLKCDDCNVLVKGQNEAVEHSKNTGHAHFGET